MLCGGWVEKEKGFTVQTANPYGLNGRDDWI